MVRLAEIYECSVAMYAWKYIPTGGRPGRHMFPQWKYIDRLQMSPDLRRICVAGGEIHTGLVDSQRNWPLSFESAGPTATAPGRSRPQLNTRRCRISIAHAAEGKHTPPAITSGSVGRAMAARASGAPSPGHARDGMPRLFGTARTVERGLPASRTAVALVSEVYVQLLVRLRSCVHDVLSSSVVQDALRRTGVSLPSFHANCPCATKPVTPLKASGDECASPA